MATNRAKIFSWSSTLCFSTVLKRSRSSESRSVVKGILCFPVTRRRLSLKLPKFPFTIFTASDITCPRCPRCWPKFNLQCSRFGGNMLSRNATHTENIIQALLSKCIGCNSRRHVQSTSCTRPSLHRHPCLAQRGLLRERGQHRGLELDRCRKLHVERGLFFRRSSRLRLVSLCGEGAMGNTLGNQDV